MSVVVSLLQKVAGKEIKSMNQFEDCEYDGSESVVDGRDVDFSGVVVVGLLVVRSIDERVSGIFDIVVEMSNYQRSSFFPKGAQEGCFNCVW